LIRLVLENQSAVGSRLPCFAELSRKTPFSLSNAISFLSRAVPVIRQLAEVLNAYRLSMGNPQSGVMFHSGAGQHMDFDKLGQNVIRPAVEALRLEWYGWHGFRRGIASNLYELGANDKVFQRILRHAKPHVTKERYIKAFDPAVLAAMKSLEASLDMLSDCSATVQQAN